MRAIIVLLLSAVTYGTANPFHLAATPPPSEMQRCGSTIKKLWLDVIFLVDSSASMEDLDIINTNTFIASVFDDISLGDAAYQTRPGVIMYATNVSVLNELGTINTDADYPILPHFGSEGTNLEGAIALAMDQFNRRKVFGRGARPVIVIIASAYRAGAYDDPKQIASQFKEENGVIITLNYVPNHGAPDEVLAEVASPGYAFSSLDSTFDEKMMETELMRANCFCPQHLSKYSDRMDSDGIPDGGCYDPVAIASNHRQALFNCKLKHYGFVNFTSEAKQSFVLSQFAPKTKIWTGLQYDDSRKQFLWPDKTPLGSFKWWAPQQPNLKAGKCVYLYQFQGLNSGWFSDDCGNDYKFACETDPCSTDKYCAEKN